MLVPESIRKCVVFLATRKIDGEVTFRGSGFFLADNSNANKLGQVVLVTARHVIQGAIDLGLKEIIVRVNLKNGESEWFTSSLDKWCYHPSDDCVDVAMLSLGLPERLDHKILPTSLCATEDLLSKFHVGLGDEVFVVGLYRHHRGDRRNIPIVRIGNLSSFAEEKIETEEFGEIEGYLIEARSIGGLSGSPVFINLGGFRMVDGHLRSLHKGDPSCLCLGLIHGHVDEAFRDIEPKKVSEAGKTSRAMVNTGIAIVVPFKQIREVYDAVASQGKRE
jgi:hypothetical protein